MVNDGLALLALRARRIIKAAIWGLTVLESVRASASGLTELSPAAAAAAAGGISSSAAAQTTPHTSGRGITAAHCACRVELAREAAV
jgi:hypothetical protein